MNTHDLLRHIPKVDDLLNSNDVMTLLREVPRHLVVTAIRDTLDTLRQDILQHARATVMPLEDVFEQIRQHLARLQERHLKRVINGTGIIVHTNLGRSCLSQAAIQAVIDVAGSYSNLEYDLERGARGSRHSHIEGLLCELLGCEAAFVVNNNAAAILLALLALAQGKEAIVSRGELVEIGGSFRIPDVMQQGGCVLQEVGTTNRTHLRDYEQAINERTGVLLRVHTSNYRVVGFTKSVPLEDLHALSVKAGVPLVEDMGSGLLISLARYGLGDEPTVQESLNKGVDVVTFSGDKLLGGPQAGMIAGKTTYVERMKAHPLHRALRIDKMTLAALEATLAHYRDSADALRNIVTLRYIIQTEEALRAKAQALLDILAGASIPARIIQAASHVGGGALPLEQLPTHCVAICLDAMSPNELDAALRRTTPPILGRIANDHFLLDTRTIEENDFAIIAAQIRAILLENPAEKKEDVSNEKS